MKQDITVATVAEARDQLQDRLRAVIQEEIQHFENAVGPGSVEYVRVDLLHCDTIGAGSGPTVVTGVHADLDYQP